MVRLLMCLVASALCLAGCASPAGESGTGGGFSSPAAGSDEPQDLALYGVNGDPFVGNASASVQVVSYEAPGCSNCKRYHFSELPAILEDYADTGQIGYHFLQFTVGYQYDLAGGIAAECAFREGGTPAYTHIMDLIFNHQSTPKLPEYLDETAAEFGLDADVLQACYEAEETAGEVDADIQGGRDSGAGSNPGFAIIGPDSVEFVRGADGPRAAIERALA